MTQPHLRPKSDNFDEAQDEFNKVAREIAAQLVWAGLATPEEALSRSRILAKQRFAKNNLLIEQALTAPLRLTYQPLE